MERQAIIRKLEGILDLPTLPLVVTKVKEAVRDPNSDAKRISKILEDDPAIMSRILKVVNSPLYAAREPITSLQTAVARMGMNAVSNLAMTTSVFQVFGKEGGAEFSREDYWRHCICTGIATAVLYGRFRSAIRKSYTPDVLHLCGLLHDMGKLVLIRYFTKEFSQALQCAADEAIPLDVAEKKTIGMDHAEIGQWLAERWKLAPEHAAVIRYHHNPEAVDPEARELVMLCHCANYICNLESLGNGGDTDAPAFREAVWGQLGMALSDVGDVVDAIGEEAKKSEILMAFV